MFRRAHMCGYRNTTALQPRPVGLSHRGSRKQTTQIKHDRDAPWHVSTNKTRKTAKTISDAWNALDGQIDHKIDQHY